MNGPTNDDWLEVRAERQSERTALVAKYRCTPDSTDSEWERLNRALAAFDAETEQIYEKRIWERYHSGVYS
jgi:hypothetical protein